jgi:serine/threonine protein kinase
MSATLSPRVYNSPVVLHAHRLKVPMTLIAGTRLGPYEIQSAIGVGGMGEMYKARDTRLDRTVAIKILPPAVAAEPERRARCEREAKTIAALDHPNICPLHDVGDHDSSMFREDVQAKACSKPRSGCHI